MKKKVGIVLLILGIILLGTGIYLQIHENSNIVEDNPNKDSKIEHKTNATKEEMKYYNSLMNEHYYGYVSDFDTETPPSGEGTIFAILYSHKEEKNVVEDEVKFQLGVDLERKIYGLSKEIVNKEILEKYGVEFIQYNFLDTSNTGDVFLLQNDMIYYSIPEQDKYIYFIKDIQTVDMTVTIEFWEYLLTTSNSARFETLLTQGKIPNDQVTSKLEVTFQKNEAGELKMISKNTLEEN